MKNNNNTVTDLKIENMVINNKQKTYMAKCTLKRRRWTKKMMETHYPNPYRFLILIMQLHQQ